MIKTIETNETAFFGIERKISTENKNWNITSASIINFPFFLLKLFVISFLMFSQNKEGNNDHALASN